MAIAIETPKGVVRKAATKTFLAALGPSGQAILGPPLVTTGVVSEAVRGVAVADLLVVTTIPNVEGPLKASVRLLRLRAASPNGATPTMTAAIMARTYEAPACRGPVVPSTGLTSGLARGIAIARLASTKPNTGPFPARPRLVGP